MPHYCKIEPRIAMAAHPNTSRLILSIVYRVLCLTYFLWLDFQLLLKIVEFILYRMDVILTNIQFLGLQYATFHNVAIQQAFFWMALRADIAELKGETELCNRLRNMSEIVFKYIVIPLSTLVCVNFWMLFGVLGWPIEDMNIIRDHVPLWLNHCLHTVIVFLNLGELALEPRHFPLQNGVVGSALLVLFYAAWICTIKGIAGKWPYPYFSNFNMLQLRMYFFGNVFLSVSSYVAAAEINRRIWRNGGQREKKGERNGPASVLYELFLLKKTRDVGGEKRGVK